MRRTIFFTIYGPLSPFKKFALTKLTPCILFDLAEALSPPPVLAVRIGYELTPRVVICTIQVIYHPVGRLKSECFIEILRNII